MPDAIFACALVVPEQQATSRTPMPSGKGKNVVGSKGEHETKAILYFGEELHIELTQPFRQK
jgi:hypothetical protein